MADSDNVLKVLVELGVLGKEDVQAANNLIKEIGNEVEKAAENSTDLTTAKEAEAEVTGKANLQHEATKVLFGELKEIVPGLGEALETGLTNPVAGAVAVAIFAIDSVSKAVEATQEKFKKLIEDGQKINNVLGEIIKARPTATDDRVKFTEQVAKLKESSGHGKFVTDQFINTVKGYDQNKINAAFDFQKPGLERKAITDEIAVTKTELGWDKAKGGNLADAQKKANDTAATSADLKKQIETLPKAIEAAQTARDHAMGLSKTSFSSPDQLKYGLEAQNYQESINKLTEELATAKSKFPAATQAAADAEQNFNNLKENNTEIRRLTESLVALQNKLGIFDDKQFQNGKTQQIQQTIDYGKGTGQSIGEMGAAIHLSQAQTVEIATRIMNHQLTYQQAIDGLHARMEQIEQQAKNSRNGRTG